VPRSAALDKINASLALTPDCLAPASCEKEHGRALPMDIVPGPGFAAELRGVTLADTAADDAAYAAARAASKNTPSGVSRPGLTDELQLAFSRVSAR